MTVALTFRVSCIPAEVPDLDLANFLVEVIPDLATTDNIRIGSRAPALEDVFHRVSSVATILVKDVPACFRDGLDRWSFPITGRVKDLIVDKHFDGFTPLNDVGYRHEFDCIAISGLASHPYGSWRCRKGTRPGTDFMWLRDQLPKDRPSFRVMCYGYDSTLIGSNSFQTIDHLALNFAKQLVDMRIASNARNPIIFLAHSLGGIVLKGALAYLARGSDIYTSTLEAVKIVMLFGVPNTGMHISHLQAMTKAQPNEQLVEDLSYESSYLKSLDERFSNHSKLRDIKLLAAFETMTSPTAMLSQSGTWSRIGPREVLVPESSATAITGLQRSDSFAINEDHSNMIKFSPNEIAYRGVLAAISQVVKDLLTTTQQESSRTHMDAAVQETLNASSIDMTRDRPIEWFGATHVLAGVNFTPAQWLDYHRRVAPDLRDSLRFEEISLREDDIADAQNDTFSWVMQDESLGFKAWLKSRSGLYWIRGKPGSGKSTLMKFLHKDRNINDMLSSGHVGYQNIVVWFFFHERGSVLQKSYEGLLRSILLSVIRANEECAVEVLKIFVMDSPQHQWTHSKLERAIDLLRKQKGSPMRITMFLDALDEYYGAPETITNILKTFQTREIGSTVDFKICFSSRPWDAFVENFDTEPGFVIHDQTMGDAQRYIERRFSASSKLLDIFIDSQYEMVQDFVRTILRRAEGVFLWLRFVIDVIQISVQRDGFDTLEKLGEVLSELPDDLETYYRRSIERMSTGDRVKARILLEILYRAVETLDVDEMFYAAICAQQPTFKDCTIQLHQAMELDMSPAQMSQRLLNLCGGLIETKQSQPYKSKKFGGTQPEHESKRIRVQFIHQTAKEFFAKPSSMQAFLGPESKFRLSREDGNTYLAKFWLTNNALRLVDLAPFNVSEYRAMIYARESEFTTGAHMGGFLESMNWDDFLAYKEPYTLEESSWSIDGMPSHRHDNLCDSPRSFGIYANLQLYSQSYLRNNKSFECLTSPERMPLLHCAILNIISDRNQFPRNVFKKKMSGMAELHARRQPYLLDLLKLLIAGTDLKTKYKGYTAIQLWIRGYWLANHASVRLLVTEFRPTDVWTSITAILLATGHSPNLVLSKTKKDLDLMIRDAWTVNMTTILHCAVSIAKQLYEAGAELNVLDGHGRTPLDFWFEMLDFQHNGRQGGTMIFVDEHVDAMTCLARHGGKLTKRGARYRDSFFLKMKLPGKSGSYADLAENTPIPHEWLSIPIIPTSAQDSGDFDEPGHNSSRFKTSLRRFIPRHRS